MFRLFSLAVALAVTALLCESNASAQFLSQGYQMGTGFQAAGLGHCGGGLFRSMPREQLPYFAQYPPVYYSHIVPRPYGISPYAVPPGIAPVEMSVPVVVPHPVSIKNPFYNGTAKTGIVVPATEPESKKETDGKTTRNQKVVNPHFVPALELVERN